MKTTPSKKLTQTPLPYNRAALEPVLSRENIDYHYGHLYKNYVEHYNNHEGSRQFNQAGAFLHSIYFSQFTQPGKTQPGPLFLDLIKRYRRLDVFKDEMLEVAMAIHGSGWVYLADNGTIKTISNHEQRPDIILLIDWWEHAWNPDYLWRKDEYFKNIWRIIDWESIETRIATGDR